jgi:hypothetical protein
LPNTPRNVFLAQCVFSVEWQTTVSQSCNHSHSHSEALPHPKLILLHKQATSGRVRFLCWASGVLAFSPLPTLAALRDEDYRSTLQYHPTAVLREAETLLSLNEGSITPEIDFQAWVDTPSGDIPILLGILQTLDPPFNAASQQNARFIALTDSRGLSEVERHLLRRAYEQVLG